VTVAGGNTMVVVLLVLVLELADMVVFLLRM
jgi:hypothetical protein